MLSVIFRFFFFSFGLLFKPCQLLSRNSYSLAYQFYPLNRWMIVFIYSSFIFPYCLFLLWAYVYVPGHGMSHHFLDGEQVTGLTVFSTRSQSLSFHFYFVVFFSLLLSLLPSLYLYLFLPRLLLFLCLSFAQVYRATLLWENKHDCLSVPLSQTGPHKHWSSLG